MSCSFPGCKRPTPSDWCIMHAKHYSGKTNTKAQQPLSLPELIDKAQKVFNAFIRDRDRVKGCITCGGQATEAGHFIPVGENAALRFTEENVNGQCHTCNVYKTGNRSIYRAVMIQKYGLEKVEELETAPSFNKWSRTQLENIISTYSK